MTQAELNAIVTADQDAALAELRENAVEYYSIKVCRKCCASFATRAAENPKNMKVYSGKCGCGSTSFATEELEA